MWFVHRYKFSSFSTASSTFAVWWQMNNSFSCSETLLVVTEWIHFFLVISCTLEFYVLQGAQKSKEKFTVEPLPFIEGSSWGGLGVWSGCLLDTHLGNDPGKDQRHTGEIIALDWFKKVLGSFKMNWWMWLGRGTSGSPRLNFYGRKTKLHQWVCC